MSLLTRVAVIVPAADEEQRIAACLASVDTAVARLAVARPGIRCEVVVVLDRCTDATGRLAAAAGARLVDSDHRRVGRARQLGSDAAADSPDRTWLANTDADSQVPPQWLTEQVAHAEAGADLVLGTVRPDLEDATLRRWRALHDTGDGHPHVHGANFGIRAGALALLGGWPDLATGEDVVLVGRAVAAGLTVVRSGRHPVVTSARRTGRAPKGFSSYLAAMDSGVPVDPAVG